MYIIHFYGSGFTTLIRFNYWILCETVLPGQGDVPRLAEVDFTDTDSCIPKEEKKKKEDTDTLIKTGLMFHKYHLLNQLQVFMRYKKLPN